jgi:hypothetical protein
VELRYVLAALTLMVLRRKPPLDPWKEKTRSRPFVAVVLPMAASDPLGDECPSGVGIPVPRLDRSMSLEEGGSRFRPRDYSTRAQLFLTDRSAPRDLVSGLASILPRHCGDISPAKAERRRRWRNNLGSPSRSTNWCLRRNQEILCFRRASLAGHHSARMSIRSLLGGRIKRRNNSHTGSMYRPGYWSVAR